MYAIKHNYNVMITMDADGQLPAETSKFHRSIDAGASVVVGNRMMKPQSVKDTSVSGKAKFFKRPMLWDEGLCLNSLNQ